MKRQQQGAVLIIMALMTGALLAVFYLLAFRNFVIRDVSRQLRALADRACSEAARRSYLPKEAAGIFVQEFEAGAAQLRYAQMKNASLRLGTMGSGGFTSNSTCDGSYVPGPSTVISCDFPLPHGAGCTYVSAICTGDEQFYPTGVFEGNVSNGATLGCEASAVVTGTGVMNFVYYLQPLFRFITGGDEDPPADEPIKVHVSWWRPLENFPLGDYTDSITNFGIRHGLTLIVSPYGQTDPAESRFHEISLNNQAEPPLPGEFIDPQEFLPFDVSPPNVRSGITAFSQAQIRTNELATGADPAVTLPGIPPPPNGVAIDGKWSHLLASCANPAVLARNAFLTTLVGLAMRHGHFRDRTRILLPNPYHRNRGDDTNDGVVAFTAAGTPPFYDATLPARPNQPTMVWNFGKDLALSDTTAEQRIQFPYLSFFGGVADGSGGQTANDLLKVESDVMGRPLGAQLANVSGVCGEKSCQGWTQPFIFASGTLNAFKWRLAHPPGSAYQESPTGPNLRLGEFHHLVSAQLASCYQLYTSGNGGVRPDISHTNLEGSYATMNAGYEPSLPGTGLWELDDNLRSISNPNMWRQNCDPYAFCAQELLTPLEFMAGLGMPSLCPSEPSVSDFPYEGAWSGCVRPADPAIDLKGDLIGALSFVKGYDPATDLQVRAVKLPGNFPVLTGNSQPAAPLPATPSHAVEPFPGSAYINYGAPGGELSTVVIFTHQRISVSSVVQGAGAQPVDGSLNGTAITGNDLRWEGTHLQRLINELNSISRYDGSAVDPRSNLGRRVIFIYMPLYQQDANTPSIQALSDIIDCVPEVGVPCTAENKKTINKLIVLSPYAFNATGGVYEGLSGNALFQRYWSDLLLPAKYRVDPADPDQNIPLDMKSLAESVFESILRYEPKL